MNEIEPQGELLELYFSECSQLVQSMEKLLLTAEEGDREIDIAELFRISHTLKGSSAMMDFVPLTDCAHSFEDILSSLKSGKALLNEQQKNEFFDVGLDFCSYFRGALAKIMDGDSPVQNARLTASINALSQKLQGEPIAAQTISHPTDIEAASLREGELRVRITLKKCSMAHVRARVVAKSITEQCEFVAAYPADIDKDPNLSEQILREGFLLGFVPKNTSSADEVIARLSAQPYVESCEQIKLPLTEAKPEESAEMHQNLSVSQETVNSLLSLISDIAVKQSALEAHIESAGIGSSALQNKLSELRRAVANADVMAAGLGLQAVEKVFLQMQRTVRGMAKELNKEIKVRLLGSEVRVEASTMEILSDSLIHLVRNAADHGIELPEVREANGKPRYGQITLSASKSNDYLIVVVSDDGGGIKSQAVLDRAERDGKLTKPKEQYTESDISELLLMSGVSTKAEVSKFSGRGVGLDTVLRRLRQVGGSVSVASTAGQGTTFTLRIPVTLVVIEGIEVMLPTGEELIVPANSTLHIFDNRAGGSTAYASGSSVLEYMGEKFELLRFPNQKTNKIARFSLILTKDYGNVFITLRRVRMMKTYYIKQLPSCVSELLGNECIYFGCAACTDNVLRFVLDVEKLLRYTKDRQNQKGS